MMLFAPRQLVSSAETSAYLCHREGPSALLAMIRCAALHYAPPTPGPHSCPKAVMARQRQAGVAIAVGRTGATMLTGVASCYGLNSQTNTGERPPNPPGPSTDQRLQVRPQRLLRWHWWLLQGMAG